MKTILAKLKQDPQLYYALSIAASWAGAGSLMNSTTMARTLGVLPALIWCFFNTIACIVFGWIIWTLPIVVRPDYTIIDGFHRWTVAGREPLKTILGGKVPVVIVDHGNDEAADVYGTITHNRARGTHLLEPMKAIVKKLLDEGKSVQEIGKQLGMKPEEVFRLSGFSRDEFLDLMTKGHDTYSRAVIYQRM